MKSRHLLNILIVFLALVHADRSVAQELKARATIEAHDWDVHSVAFSPDGKALVSGSGDKTVKLWDVENGKLLKVFKHPGGVPSVAFSPNGKMIAAYGVFGDLSTVKIWHIATGREFASLDANTHYAKIAFSPDGRSLAIAGSDKTVKIWEVASGKLRKTLRKPEEIGHVHRNSAAIQFSPDGKTLAVGCANPVYDFRLIDIASGRVTKIFENADMGSFSPDGKTIAVPIGSESIEVWKLEGDKQIATLKGHGESAPPYLVFTPNGRTLVAAGDGIRLWDVGSGKRTFAVEAHKNLINALAISPDGKVLATGGSFDTTIRLWDIVNGGQGMK